MLLDEAGLVEDLQAGASFGEVLVAFLPGTASFAAALGEREYKHLDQCSPGEVPAAFRSGTASFAAAGGEG